jgi:hypothetical protein
MAQEYDTSTPLVSGRLSPHLPPEFTKPTIPPAFQPLFGVFVATAALSVAYGIANKVDPTKTGNIIHQTLGNSNLEFWQAALILLAVMAVVAGIKAAYDYKDDIRQTCSSFGRGSSTD